MSKKSRPTLDSLMSDSALTSQVASDGNLEAPSPSLPTEKKAGRRPHVKQQTVYLKPEVYEQLRKLAFDERKKMHDLWLEGLDRVFGDRGLPGLDELMGKDGR